jgi:hypothetical protein
MRGPVGNYFHDGMVFQTSSVLERKYRQLALRMSLSPDSPAAVAESSTRRISLDEDFEVVGSASMTRRKA